MIWQNCTIEIFRESVKLKKQGMVMRDGSRMEKAERTYNYDYGTENGFPD